MYMHHRFSIFHEEVLEKYFRAKYFWYRFVNLFHFKTYLLFSVTYIFIIFLPFIFFRYEWQHRGSAHIHGFLWLEDAPNMDTLDWKNPLSVVDARTFFDR